MTCPKCGANNIDGSSFCIKCGANLKELQNSTPIDTTNIVQIAGEHINLFM